MNTVSVAENKTEKDYLAKVNFWMLLLCLVHIPFIMGIAYTFNTGVLSAMLVGALISVGPFTSYVANKSSRMTSIILGIAFMGFSALLIHHARGMIEMHFHIFAFLAILIVFANPWVIVAAAATIAVHHVSFYFLLPTSVFNYQATFGIVVVHALFVVFETIPAIIISNSFKKYIIAQGSIVKNLDILSEKILTSAEEAAFSGASLSQNAKDQSSALHSTVSAIEEVNAMIHRSVENANKSQIVSNSSKNSADQGKSSVTKMIDSITEISQCNNQMTNQFNDLNMQLSEIVKIISEIGTKTKVINEIVFQTKLLSFNASVEAARAGENGKGFAVVAEEIGNLATMSGKASQEINILLDGSIKKVENIVGESKIKITALNQTTQEKIKSGSTTAIECQDSLDLIVSNVKEAIALMNDINNSAKEQLKGVDDISRAMKKLNDVTLQNTQAADLSADASNELKEQAMGIKEVVQNLLKAAN